jgi:hypothetical protein
LYVSAKFFNQPLELLKPCRCVFENEEDFSDKRKKRKKLAETIGLKPEPIALDPQREAESALAEAKCHSQYADRWQKLMSQLNGSDLLPQTVENKGVIN